MNDIILSQHSIAIPIYSRVLSIVIFLFSMSRSSAILLYPPCY